MLTPWIIAKSRVSAFRSEETFRLGGRPPPIPEEKVRMSILINCSFQGMPPVANPGGGGRRRIIAPALEADFLRDIPDDSLAKVWDTGDSLAKLVYGMEYAKRGVSDAALTLLVDSLNAIRSGVSNGVVSLAALLQLIGELYVTQENYDKAYEMLSASVARMREEGNVLACTLVHLGDVQFRRNMIDEALALYDEAIALLWAQDQKDLWLLGIAMHSLAGVHRRKEVFDVAEVIYKGAVEFKRRVHPPTSPTCLWTDGALVELKELREKKARGASAEVNPTAALLRPRDPVKEIDPIAAYPEYGLRSNGSRRMWVAPRTAPACVEHAMDVASHDLVVHESGTVPMALAVTSDRPHVDSHGGSAHRLVLTYGLEKCHMEPGRFQAVYKFTPRKMDTYISNTGPEVKRLVGNVWIKMFKTYRLYSLGSGMPKLVVDGEWTGAGWKRSLAWEGLDTDVYGFETRPREELPWLFRYATPLANVFRLKGAAPWDSPNPESYLVWELNRVLPEGVPLDVLESLDFETVQEGLQVLRRDPSETGEPDNYLPRRHLMGVLLPRLEDPAFRFFLCHGNDEAVHVADLCKFAWWIVPWVACGHAEEKLMLLYGSLVGEGFTRLLVTHNPGPIIKSRVSHPAGTCVVTISSSVAAVVVLHVLEASGGCIAIRVMPVFLWGTGDGTAPGDLVFVGEEPGFYSPAPPLIYGKPRTRVDASRLFPSYEWTRVMQLMDANLFEAAGGLLEGTSAFTPMEGLDENLASSELRRRPMRRSLMERGPVPSDPAMLMRGLRPYSQEGFEDDFDQEIRASYIPDYLRCRRVVGDHDPMPSTEVPTTENPWVIHLGRPFSRIKLGYRASFLVMVEVLREVLQQPGSVSLRMRADGDYFQEVRAAWRSVVVLDDRNVQKVEVLPLVALDARVVDEVNREPGSRNGRLSLLQLWERLPKEVTVEVISHSGKDGPVQILSSARFEVVSSVV